jgi:hypothetical protein
VPGQVNWCNNGAAGYLPQSNIQDMEIMYGMPLVHIAAPDFYLIVTKPFGLSLAALAPICR